MACPHCKMEPIDGVTHHLSRCPMRRSPVRKPTVRERAFEEIRSLLSAVHYWFKDYEDEIFWAFITLFILGVIAFFVFYPE